MNKDHFPEELLLKYFFTNIPNFLKPIFPDNEPVWTPLKELKSFFEKFKTYKIEIEIPDGVVLKGERIFIGEGTTIEPGVMIREPAIIGRNVEIRQGAYFRGNVIVADNCVVGHATELKHSIMLEGAHAPHFNYLGDSILGQKVNLGAGTILSNFKMTENKMVVVDFNGEKIDTGLRKFGALLGDFSETGCNAVLNPGTIVGPNSLIYPLSLVRGYIAPKTIYKLRQHIERTEKK
ncbi:MAG: glucose-1-phosphate thymidylyltransferase [Candidatus Schekmanbacteria bacterium]|nr:MAG: glucose-1-phosphate thymidylyltransferase [Candidatus Schekmanbacteria bacterium]